MLYAVFVSLYFLATILFLCYWHWLFSSGDNKKKQSGYSGRHYDDSYYSDSSSDEEEDDEEDEDGGFDTDMTKDYYGRHGEFDENDEARSTSEYIQIFHNEDPDADPTDNFHWDEVLDAESDGYLDD